MKINTVINTLFRFVSPSLKKPYLKAFSLLGWFLRYEKNATNAPIYSSLFLTKEKDFHKKSSQKLVAMKSEIADTNP